METLTINVHGGLAREHFIRPLKVADRFQLQASAQVRNDLFPHVRAQLVVAVNVRLEDQTRNAEVARGLCLIPPEIQVLEVRQTLKY